MRVLATALLAGVIMSGCSDSSTDPIASNDTDADGDTLTYRISDEGQLGGRATISRDGQLSINAPFIFGTAFYWVEYEVDDGWGGVDSATARIRVTW